MPLGTAKSRVRLGLEKLRESAGARVTPDRRLRIRDVVERTGVGEATLRAWEQRYGFPEPQRLPSGHRRYRESDVERACARSFASATTGLPVKAAIERARAGRRGRAEVRLRRPAAAAAGAAGQRAARSAASSRSATRSRTRAPAAREDLLLFGAFQRERHYRGRRGDAGASSAARRRWRSCSPTSPRRAPPARRPDRGADRRARPAGARVVDRLRQRATGLACLVGWEPPGQERAADAERLFETIWTADRADGAHGGAHLLRAGLRRRAATRSARIAERLAEPSPRSGDDLRRAESLTSRMIAYLAGRSDAVALERLAGAPAAWSTIGSG